MDTVDHIVHTDHILEAEAEAEVEVEVDVEVEVEVEVEVDQQVDHLAHQAFQSTVSLIKVKDLRKYLCALTV